MKKSFWLSYDLGVGGDYEGLYEWLDSKKAIECGESVAYFQIDVKSANLKDIKKLIKSQISKKISTNSKTRIYLIWKNDKGGISGSFIFGSRKPSPWAGYNVIPSGTDGD